MLVTLEGRNWIYQNQWEAGQTHNPQVGQPNFKRPCPPVRVIQSSRHIIDSPSSWDLASRAFWRAHVTSDLLSARVHHRVTLQVEATLPLDAKVVLLKSLNSVMRIIKVTHNTCSLHLTTHFQNQTSHMGIFYMVYWWQGWSLNVITWGEHNKILLSTWNENPNKHQNLFTQKVMTSQFLGHSSLTPSPSPPVN